VSLLTDRASALRAFFRLVNADSTDEDMTEHDNSTLEGAYEALDVGAARAQLFLIGIGMGSQWRTIGSALSVSGSDPNRKAALPADFLQLEADPKQYVSGLRYSTGLPWGMEVTENTGRRAIGNYYWIEWDATPATDLAYVHFARGAAVPTTLLPYYYRRLDTLADGTNIEMRADDRPLVPAYAADYAMNQAWFSGGQEQRSAITQNLASAQKEAYRRGRLTRGSRQVQTVAGRGRWIV